VRERETTVAAFIGHSSVPRRWTSEELAFLRSVGDQLEAGVRRHSLEQHKDTINAEINHRLKNMMSMVQAIAGQTLRRVVEREPIETFEKRLVALSAAHDILTQQSWSEADIRVVAEATFRPIGSADQLTLSGPQVPLGPRAALSTALLFHELMTNACKYGALSVPGGRVVVEWEVTAEDQKNDLVVRWQETGGPAVTPPTRKGFGSRLIQMGLVGTGGVEIRYEPAGLQAEMRASISHLATS
jgi:two-component sensor histidine kinase